MDRLHINNEMACLDRKQRDFYDTLTDEERKKFSLFLMIRWSSAVHGTAELQEYYVQSCNHYLNRNFFAVSQHPKLQWLMATAVSPGLGTPKHAWIAPKKRVRNGTDHRRLLLELFPMMKSDDVDLLAAINDPADIKQYERDLGR